MAIFVLPNAFLPLTHPPRIIACINSCITVISLTVYLSALQRIKPQSGEDSAYIIIHTCRHPCPFAPSSSTKHTLYLSWTVLFYSFFLMLCLWWCFLFITLFTVSTTTTTAHQKANGSKKVVCLFSVNCNCKFG